MASINDLPDEILVTIFSYFSIEEITLHIRNVCTGWRLVCEDYSIWKNYTYFPKKNTPIEEIMLQLRNMSGLRKFQYCGIHNVVEKLSECCRKISVLIIPNIQLSASLLKLAMERLTELRVLHILILPSTEGGELTNIIGESQTLHSLILRSSSTYTLAEGLLKPIAEGCPNLKKLKFEDLRLPNSEICYVIKCKTVQLQAYGHYGRISANLIKAINECTNLKSLTFNTFEADDDVRQLPPTTQLQNLTALRVSCSSAPVVEQILATLFINTLPRLTYLGMSTFGNIDALTNQILLQCPLLTHLSLEGNTALQSGALSNISSCKMLKYLDVSDCTKLDAEAMKFVAEGCPELQHLDVSNIPMSDGLFRQILRCRNLKTLLMKNCDLRYIDLNLISTNISGLLYLYSGPAYQLPHHVIYAVNEAMPKLVIKMASYFCDGSEYSQIKTDFIPVQFQ
jgi:hypothetical protein